MSKKAGAAWIPILNVILGLVAVVGFFLPFMTVLIFSVSGYDLAVTGGYAAALIIPVGGVIALIFGLLAILTKGNSKLYGWLILIGGLIVLIGAIYIFIQPGVSSFAGIGLFLELIAGVLLVIFGLLQALGK
jgi:hypothetical protein